MRAVRARLKLQPVWTNVLRRRNLIPSHFFKEPSHEFLSARLPYAYDALGPYVSRETLEYHHDKHHLAYVNNGNNAIKGTEWEGKPIEEIIKGSFGKTPAILNNIGQHYNHSLFWLSS